MTLHMGDGHDADLAAREGAADDRECVADHRQMTARETALEHRIERLLRAAAERDRLAEERDRRAEQRDRVAEGRVPGCLEEAASAAAADRKQSEIDRYHAGVDRDLSAGDRADLVALAHPSELQAPVPIWRYITRRTAAQLRRPGQTIP
jgi:hypothetical protein